LEGNLEGLQEWRVRGGFGGVCKMEACLEALLEMDFCTKPPNFGVEAHMEAPAGDALTSEEKTLFKTQLVETRTIFFKF
jgi:hypothetical protein